MPSNAPAKPAIAAEIANTASLVQNRFTPSVAHAAGLSRMRDEPAAERAAPHRDDAETRRCRTAR